MLGFFAYWKEFFRLLRTAPSNPMVRVGAPWRLGKAPALWAFLQIGGALCVIAWLVYYGFQSPELALATPREEIISSRLNYSFMVSLLAIFWYAPFAFGINLLAFSQRWYDPGRLEELYVTPMRQRDMAFGSIFWAMLLPLVTVAIFFVAIFAVVIIETFRTFQFERQGIASFDYSLNIELIQRSAFVLAAGGFTLCTMCGTLKSWLYNMKHRWTVILLGPLAGIAYLGLGLFFAIAGTSVIVETFDYRMDYIYPLFAGIIAIPYIVSITRNTGKLASSLFIRPVDMDAYISHAVLANEGLRYYHKELRKPIRAALRQHVPIPWIASGVAVTAGFIISSLLLLLKSFLPHGKTGYDLEFGFLFLCISTTLVLLYLLNRNNGRIPLMSGAPVTSVKRHCLPVYMAFLAYTFVFGFPSLAGMMNTTTLFTDVLVAALVFILYQAIFATINTVFVALIAPASSLRLLFIPLYVVFTMTLFFISEKTSYGEAFWTSNMKDELGLALVLFVVVLLYNMMTIFQRMYQRELLGVPMGETNKNRVRGNYQE